MILEQHQIAQAFALTTRYVTILDVEGKRLSSVVPSEAAELLTRGKYLVGGSPKRVKYLRQNGPCPKPRAFPIDLNYQDGRAVLKYWSDQRSAGGHSRAA